MIFTLVNKPNFDKYAMKGVGMRYFFIILSFILIPFLAQSQDGEREWELKKQKSGIAISTRLMEGSKYKEYKSRCEIDATPEKLVALLLDVEKYTDWMAFIEFGEIVERDGEDIFYVYSEVDVPWPFNNRDQVTKSVVSRDTSTNSISIDVSIIPDYMPEKKGVVRLQSGRGLWRFTPLKNGKTEAYHQFGGDPGGNIPAWIVNMFLVDGPYKTMLGLQEMMAKD